jgi:hypothetical protein
MHSMSSRRGKESRRGGRICYGLSIFQMAKKLSTNIEESTGMLGVGRIEIPRLHPNALSE